MTEDLSGLKPIFDDPAARITVLTGAGISAESGIPTFRGPEGYWTVGSRVYMPQEIATQAMFQRNPAMVWSWYLYRLGVCLKAEPNAGHRALVEMEHLLGDRFLLITQNIDNLHLRAGNSLSRTFQIHGNVNTTRCSAACGKELLPLPEVLLHTRNQPDLSDTDMALLHCRHCGQWLRPHVLWFDEYYDEEHFYFDSCIAAAGRTDLLIIVGTSASTNLPVQVAAVVCDRQGTIIDINIEENPFSALALRTPGGQFYRRPASRLLPELMAACTS